MFAQRFVTIAACALVAACTRTVVIRDPQPAPPPPTARAPEPRPEPPRTTAAMLGIPAGHLPQAGECRIWIPGMPPGRQRDARSRTCLGIAREAPAGSWIVYRPTRDRRVVHVRVVHERRPGVILLVRVFDYGSGRFLREEAYDDRDDRDDDRRGRRDRRDDDRRDDDRRDDGRDDRDGRTTPGPAPAPAPAPAPPPTGGRGVFRPRETPQPAPAPAPTPGKQPEPAPAPVPAPAPPPAEGPFGERRKPTGEPAPAPAPSPAPAPAPGPAPAPAPNTDPLDIPPGHLPSAGECRVWIPGTPPGRQPRNSGECAAITREAPAGSWVVYRPATDRRFIYVRVVDAQRVGVIVVVRVYDDRGKFLREERP